MPNGIRALVPNGNQPSGLLKCIGKIIPKKKKYSKTT